MTRAGIAKESCQEMTILFMRSIFMCNDGSSFFWDTDSYGDFQQKKEICCDHCLLDSDLQTKISRMQMHLGMLATSLFYLEKIRYAYLFTQAARAQTNEIIKTKKKIK